ncbi:CotH kinase family protein [Granulosicoccus antarcticus]|uniref:Chitinase A1 n=1 Tax=Granulosicoccus antarcticus IMCC3135 TaxID=1192854 RepID=A0A2Z2NRS7_9GAMM|nr:CotH kinase family protein [Granulosicoccus antarcticus]ASJ73949.1 Chitinase A1 [Granulosicoccus antarcticus IMCC3135]
MLITNRSSFVQNRSRMFTFILLIVGTSTTAFAEDPSQPGDLRYQVYSNTAAELFWNRSSDDLIVTGYEIKINGTIATTKDALSYFTAALVAGSAYEFAVTALDNEGNRSTPATVSFIGGDRETPSIGDPVLPPVSNAVSAPGNLRGDVYSPSTIEVFWDRVTGATLNYEVSLNGQQATTTNGTSWYIDGLQSAQQYTVDVVALDAAGNRSEPASVTVTTRSRGPVTDPGTGPIVGNSVFIPDSSDIEDPDEFYDQDGYETVNVVRLDVRTEAVPGICTVDDTSGCTLADIIADVDHKDDFKAEIAVHFQGDDFADDGSVSNATLRQRGGSSRAFPQKSFRIKLDSKENLWRNERRLQLNKNPLDKSRIRNKLSFDLMSELPYLPSLRTQFFNLWIDDGQGPVDYGLYTHAEYAGKEYLVNRDRNEDDNIYKIEFFAFSQSDLKNVQVDESGEPVDLNRFETSLEIERGEDHRKLVDMLTAMNDPARSFDSVLDQYFNRNNVLMWVTANLLLHQSDAITHNFYLYNPVGSDKFYFAPWDYDLTFSPENQLINSYDNKELEKRLYYGYARGIYSDFVSRYYKMPGIHEKILAAADELRNTYFTDSEITERVQRYDAAILPYLTRSPDVDFTPYNQYRTQNFASFVSGIHDDLRNSFDIPMPPTLLSPTTQGDKLVFAWKPAYDVTRRNVLSYDLQVSTSVAFEANTIVLSVEEIADAEDEVEYAHDSTALPSGKLYYRVTARGNLEPQRVWQVAANTLKIEGTTWFGVLTFDMP